MTDFDSHYPKHCVRYYGWLPACKAHFKRTGAKSLKYFTLCATQALDVFMLELEALLKRDKTGKLPDVVICEKDPTAAAAIFDLVRPPLKEAIIIAPLEDVLTFEDTDQTRGLSPEQDVRDRQVRRLLRWKGLFARLKDLFPFDVVNFDPTGNLLNPDHDRNKLHRAFRKVFELQDGISTFLLLTTTPVFDVDPSLRRRFRAGFESNVRCHAEIRQALVEAVGTEDYDGLDSDQRMAIDCAKSLIIACAREYGWEHQHEGVFIYQSPGGHRMLSSVVRLWRPSKGSGESQYVQDVLRVIREMPKYYSLSAARGDTRARAHLQRVIECRERARNELR